MTDLTAPPSDRATCGWLPLPAGPPPSPPPDRTDGRPVPPAQRADQPPAPPPATSLSSDPQVDDLVPEPAAVQAAIATLTTWLRSGGMLVCSPGGEGPSDTDEADGGRDASAGDEPQAANPDPVAEPGADPPEPACGQCRVSDDPVTVRAWARERGFRVADRGRLPAAVVAAYVAAHPHA